MVTKPYVCCVKAVVHLESFLIIEVILPQTCIKDYKLPERSNMQLAMSANYIDNHHLFTAITFLDMHKIQAKSYWLLSKQCEM
jgi:hypothetical protein